MSIYVVGDIQGCFEPLQRLLAKVEFDPEKDRLWCVGDLVNRGPDSLGVLRYLKSLGDACTCVLGNHDLTLLAMYANNRIRRTDKGLAEVLTAPDAKELIDWLRYRPLLHRDKERKVVMVHAGLHPAWSLKKARKRARRIEEKLRGANWQDFCRLLRKSRTPRTEPVEKGMVRDMFSAAVLTRTRYCTQNGKFNWRISSGGPSSKLEKPWFAHASLAWRKDYRIVYGHWAAKGIVDDQPHVLGLDSGCVWGGRLTIAKLGKRKTKLISVSCKACRTVGTD